MHIRRNEEGKPFNNKQQDSNPRASSLTKSKCLNTYNNLMRFQGTYGQSVWPWKVFTYEQKTLNLSNNS